MWKILLLIFFLNTHVAFSQTLEIDEYSINSYKVHLKRSEDAPQFWSEVPPWVINSERRHYFFTTHFTTLWSTSLSIARPKDDFIFVGASQGSSPKWIVSSSNWWGRFYDPDFLQSARYKHKFDWENHSWRRSYNGVFSAHIIEHAPSKENILFAVSHGENKNERIGNYLYQNTVRSNYIIVENNPATYSGGNPYRDCWEAYFGFLNGNWITYSDSEDWGSNYMHDIGPIAWPSAGYLKQDGSQASKGLRHPSSIIHDNNLYIYVIDESMDGRGGVKLIRSHINNILNPSAYETWSSGKWIASLPKGFTKNNITYYYKHEGPDNTPVFSPDRNTIRFSVAKIRGTNNFLGVEEYIMGGTDNTIKVALRLSSDLINWSDRIDFYSGSNWDSSVLRYPIFLNREGTSNTEIDLEEFYILGSSSSGAITKYHFKLNEWPTSSGVTLTRGLWANTRGNNIKEAKFDVSPVPAAYTIDVNINVTTSSNLVLNLYDSKGTKVRTLLDYAVKPQLITKTFDISDLKAGMYILELIHNGERQHQRIVKL